MRRSMPDDYVDNVILGRSIAKKLAPRLSTPFSLPNARAARWIFRIMKGGMRIAQARS
jgi:hypothetical protein